MGFLVSIIGNSGVGKTTLVENLASQADFFTVKEDLDVRPFQTAFARDLNRFALANQIDFLLFRAEQEGHLRSIAGIGVQDGGLDLDYHLFTRLFHHKGYLSDEEFELCGRLYTQVRSALPGPDLYVCLEAPIEVVSQRYKARNRSQEIARNEDLEKLQSFLEEWLADIEPDRVLKIDTADERYLGSQGVDRLSQAISDLLHAQMASDS
jgi:deoxyadenosine/deoxycytidine kinase